MTRNSVNPGLNARESVVPAMLNARLFKIIAFDLISFFGLLQIMTALLFLAGIPITKYHLPAAFLAGGIFTWFIMRDKGSIEKFRKDFVIAAGLVLMLIFLSIVVSSWFYDFSWDGQAYHQETILQLKDHWNPTRSYLSFTVLLSDVCNYYSRGIETLQAAIYAFTGRIESGKATNFIFFFALASLSYSFLVGQLGFLPLKASLIALLASCNPVFFYQAFTYYIDAQIYFLYAILVIAAVTVFIESDKASYFIYGFSIVLLLPAKFIAIPIAGIFIISFLLILLVFRKYPVLKKTLAVSVVFSFLGFFIVGYQPYVTNMVNHGSPFYPFAGKGAARGAPLVDQSPETFPGKNRAEKFFISLFSRTDNLQSAETSRTPELKIPFTVTKSELRIVWDQRIGGFGPFYSGIFLISVILLVYLLFKPGPGDRLYLGLLMVALFCSIAIISESWWFRYIPQLWLFTIIVIIFYEKTGKTHFRDMVLKLLYFVMIVNLLLIASGTLFWNCRDTLKLNEQLQALKEEGKPVRANFSIFSGNRARLMEHGIRFTETREPMDTAVSFSMLHSISKMCYVRDEK